MKTVMSIVGLIGMATMMACSAGPAGAQDQVAENVNAETFKQLIEEKGGLVLDVRTAEELKGGFIPESKNLDFYSDDFKNEIGKLDKEQTVYVYCAAGGRSGQTMNMLKEKGFKEVYNLSGGFPTWKEKGYEVEK